MKNCFGLIVVAVLFSSCNMFFMPKKQKIEFVTGKKEATVYVNKTEFGQGEIVKDKILKDGVCDVTVKTEGFRDYHTVLVPHIKHQVIFLCNS